MIGRSFKCRAPCRSCIRDEDIKLPLILFDSVDKSEDLCFVGHVCWNANRAAFDSWELIEFVNGLVDSLFTPSLASCDEDFLCSGVKECCRGVESKTSRSYMEKVSACFCQFSDLQ